MSYTSTEGYTMSTSTPYRLDTLAYQLRPGDVVMTSRALYWGLGEGDVVTSITDPYAGMDDVDPQHADEPLTIDLQDGVLFGVPYATPVTVIRNS